MIRTGYFVIPFINRSKLPERSCKRASFMIVYHAANEENGTHFPTPVYTNFTPDGGSDGYNEGKICGAA